MAKMGPYLTIGWVFLLAMFSGLGLGTWLDGKLGTEPMLLIFGVLLGMSLGFLNVFRVVLRIENQRKQENTRDEDTSDDHKPAR